MFVFKNFLALFEPLFFWKKKRVSTFQQTLKLTLPEIAKLHATISPAEVEKCGITNGIGPLETAYRILQLRAGEEVTGNFIVTLAEMKARESR